MSSLSKVLTAHPRLWSWVRWVLEMGFRGEMSVIAEVLSGLKPGSVVLDVGCGTGQLSRPFLGYRYLGIDLDRDFVKAATNWHGMTYAVMDARVMGIRADSVDLVLISGLLHHMSDCDARRVLSEVATVLRRDGICILMEDQPVSPTQDLPAWLIHRWDAGAHYRTADQYMGLLPKELQCLSATTMRSGLCPYVVLTLRKPGGGS